MLSDIMDAHDLEKGKKNHSPDKLSDHNIVSGFLRIFIQHIKKPRKKVYSYQKGDFETIRKDA